MAKVVAKVEGKEITEQDVMRFVQEIGPQVAMQFQSADGIKTLIEEMVNQELLLLDAKDNNLDEEEEFQETLNHTVDNLLKSYAFTKIIGDIKVDDEEAKEFFENNKPHFAKEMADASHILVDSEEKAKEIKKELDEGKDFEEAAKEYSTCPSKDNGGALGEFPRGAMVKEFEDAAFSMDEGEISDPVKSQFGYHIIKLNSKTDPADIKFEDVVHEVKQEATRLKQQEVYLQKIDELKEKYDAEIIEENIR